METERYNFYKDLHPEWSDEDIWIAVSLDKQAKDTIKNGGNDIDINRPEIINLILQKAQEWLEQVLPIIYEKVERFFKNAINSLVEWAFKGWEYLLNLIGQYC